MKKSQLVLIAVVGTGIVGPVSAGTCNWTGKGADTLWTTAENWDPAAPGNSDIAVFNPGEGKAFTVTFSDHTTAAAGFRFESGSTTFDSTTYFYFGGSVNGTNEIYVADGAVATIGNAFHGSNNMKFAKTGAGRVVFTKSFHRERFDVITEIREGTLQLGVDYDHGANIGATNIVVRADATFLVYGRGNFAPSHAQAEGAACLTVDAGGIAKFYGYNENTTTLSSLYGEGTVEMNTVSGAKPMYLVFTSKMGPSRFSGRFTVASGHGGAIKFSNLYSVPAEQFAFVVAGADTLVGLTRLDAQAAVRFAAGVGRFNAGQVRVDENATLTLEDEAGEPIDLSATYNLLSGASIVGRGRALAAGTSAIVTSGTGAEVRCPETVAPSVNFAVDNATVRFAGGRVCAKERNPAYIDDTIAVRPAGLTFGGSSDSGSVLVSDGAELYVSGTDNCGVKNLIVSNATLRIRRDYYAEKNATAADKDVIKLDGGRLACQVIGAHAHIVASGEPVTLGVGAGGGTLTTEGLVHDFQYKDANLWHSVESLAEGGADGGLTLGGCATWFINRPFTFNGLSRIHGTFALIKSAAELASTPTFFGAGDVELDSCVIGYHKDAFPATGSTCTLELGTAAGKKVTVTGAPAILVQGKSGSEVRYSSLVPQNVEIGELDFKPGAILFLSDYSVNLGSSGGSSVKVSRNAPAVSATSGRVLAPVALSTGKAVSLLSYDADRGFCPVTGTVSSFDDAAGKIVAGAYQADLTLAANTAYAADGVQMGDWGDLTFKAGATLAVGDGVNPAVLAIVGNGTVVSSGDGTAIDFGEAPGYFLVGASAAKDSGARLEVPIRTARTMTFASCADHCTNRRSLEIESSNAYAGDTYVNNIIVMAKNVGCFSSGKVHVAGGQFAGGNVEFVSSGTWENDFELSGWGMFISQYGDNKQRGAFSFNAPDVVVAGDIELKENVRMSSKAGGKGTIAGVVSGDRLFVGDSLGAIVLANDNTYTGGTELVSSALTLRKGTSAGTGPILLDAGTLCFENDEAAVFANTVEGIGTVALKGTAPVVFRGDLSGLDAPLDLCGTAQTFTELPPFAKIVNSATKKATIKLADNLGTVAWKDYTLEGRISLDLGEGTTLDLGGRTLNVYRLEQGAIGKVVNGTVNEEKPIGGVVLIVR